VLTPRDEERLDEIVERFGRIIRGMEARQSRLERRLSDLYQLAFVAFTVIVVSISFLVIILSRQVPQMTEAIAFMNERFASVAHDMARMDRSVQVMRDNMIAMPDMVAHVDGIHGSVTAITADVGGMAGALSAIDADVANMNLGVSDMRYSFEVMELSVRQMGGDVNRMSGPFRLFNQINPFR
jgi:hypothetical protein